MSRVVRITGKSGRRSSSALNRISGVQYGSFLTKFSAPNISMKLKGVNGVKIAFNKIMKNTSSATYIAIKQCSELVVKETKSILIGIGKLHAYDTGKLYDSIQYMVEEHTIYLLRTSIGSFTVPYAVFVHEGTFKMSGRPFLLTAFIRKQKLIEYVMLKALQKDLLKGFV
jgi:hypothetical protein